jgi:hypothetical protein
VATPGIREGRTPEDCRQTSRTVWHFSRETRALLIGRTWVETEGNRRRWNNGRRGGREYSRQMSESG